jgi:hypothetical protein
MIVAVVLVLSGHDAQSQNPPLTSATARSISRSPESAGRHVLPKRWWESIAAMKVVTLKKGRQFGHELSITPESLSQQLDQIKAEGFQAIHIFAPGEGLRAYNGLDTVNHYRIDPEIGTVDDFRRLIRIAHGKGIAIVAFINVGYFSLEAPDWIEACDNSDGEKAKWFLWADSPDAPKPPEHTYFNWPRGEDDTQRTWGWQYSERAGRYFWARWQTQDENGNWVGLPQNNWGDDGWAKEAETIVRFWMDTGLDGLIIDAPIYYIGLTWDKNNRHISNVIEGYGNTFRQPEGSMRVGWLTEGNYNCLQDYGLGQGRRDDVIRVAIESGDPSGIEEALREYHDIMQANGGVLYRHTTAFEEEPKRHLATATLAALGDIVVFGRRQGSPDAEEARILETKFQHPAMHQRSTRRRLPTNSDDKYFAFLRTAADGAERILVALNFQPTDEKVVIDLSGVAAAELVDLKSGEVFNRQDSLSIHLLPFGYRYFQIVPGRQ